MISSLKLTALLRGCGGEERGDGDGERACAYLAATHRQRRLEDFLTLAERKYPSLRIEKLTLPSELRELAGTEVHRVTLRSDEERAYGVDESVEDA